MDGQEILDDVGEEIAAVIQNADDTRAWFKGESSIHPTPIKFHTFVDILADGTFIQLITGMRRRDWASYTLMERYHLYLIIVIAALQVEVQWTSVVGGAPLLMAAVNELRREIRTSGL